MKKSVLIVLAEGFEEIEAVTPIDVLRRAGLEVVVAGVGGRRITGAHGVRVTADTTLEEYCRDVSQYASTLPDAVALPGGLPGADNLKSSKDLQVLLLKMKAENRLIGAICASPARVLAPAGILEGKKATCYPGFESELGPKVKFSEERVVSDGLVITSRGPGTALEFSLRLVETLVDTPTAQKLKSALLARV